VTTFHSTVPSGCSLLPCLDGGALADLGLLVFPRVGTRRRGQEQVHTLVTHIRPERARAAAKALRRLGFRISAGTVGRSAEGQQVLVANQPQMVGSKA